MLRELPQKLALWPVLLSAACLFAGAYGALHDQLSYTVSPDYFHAFKFQQFRIPAELHNRIGAAIVGWKASWWMGVFLGVPILVCSLLAANWRIYVRRTMVAYGVAAATALVIGLSALAMASVGVTETSLPTFRFPPGVDRVAFARVGIMHSFSYLGGAIGCLTGMTSVILAQFGTIRVASRS